MIHPYTQTLYLDDVAKGWQYRPFGVKNSFVKTKKAGLRGGLAACMTASPGGGAVFVADYGTTPLKDAARLDFWIKSTTTRADQFKTSTPPGKVPPLLIKLSNDSDQRACGSQVKLADIQPAETQGEWYKFKIQLTDFNCGGGSLGWLGNANRIDILNPNSQDADFCLDNIVIGFCPPGIPVCL
eukprot:gene9595-9758_t